MSFSHHSANPAPLFDVNGQRKYLCASEAHRFLASAATTDISTRTFCYLLARTGCRISEALALTPRHLDADGPRVIFRTLKRRKLTHRAVPIPIPLFADLHELANQCAPDGRIWDMCRQTAWRRVRQIMARADVSGPQAMPKGLRHGFCIRAAIHNVPPNIIGRWAGHASPTTTAIYLDAVGEEEREFAERVW